jgi:hypothetical protein
MEPYTQDNGKGRVHAAASPSLACECSEVKGDVANADNVLASIAKRFGLQTVCLLLGR